MAAVDIVFLAVIALSFLMGVLRGFVKESLSLASWVAAIVLAGVLSPQLADMMTGLMDNASLRAVAAFAILFVAIVFFGALIGNLVSRLTSAAGLGGTDRVLGGLFGVLRGVLVIVLIVFLTQPFEFTRQWYQGSLLVPYVVELSRYLQDLIDGAPAPAVAIAVACKQAPTGGAPERAAALAVVRGQAPTGGAAASAAVPSIDLRAEV